MRKLENENPRLRRVVLDNGEFEESEELQFTK